MGKKNGKKKARQFGKKAPERKTLINPKYKNTVWTMTTLVIMLIFFIVNNTRQVPDEGPYPPGFDSAKAKLILSKTWHSNNSAAEEADSAADHSN